MDPGFVTLDNAAPDSNPMPARIGKAELSALLALAIVA
jgi:hypothetical protein